MIALSKQDKEKVLQAVLEAERHTSAEIVVHVQPFCLGDPLKAAKRTFGRLRMHKTKSRNAVLVFAALLSHKFAIFGDEAVDRAAGQMLWSEAAETMRIHFAAGRPGEALAGAVERAGRELARLFPCTGENPNELPDTLSEGK